MKKTLLLSVLALGLLSCKKEAIEPEKYTYKVECESCTIQINDRFYTLRDHKTITTTTKEYIKITTTSPELKPFVLTVNSKKHSGYISEYKFFELKNLN